MEPLEKQLTDLVAEQKAFNLKIEEERKSLGSALTETKTALVAANEKITAMQTQLDAVDAKTQQKLTGGATEIKSFSELLTEHPDFVAAKEHGFAGISGRKSLNLSFGVSAFQRKMMELKTNITDATMGFGTSGLLMPVRLPGVTGLARQALRIRDVMNVVPQTTGSIFDFAKQTTRTNAPSPQIEAATKAESTYLWSTGTDSIRTIAHFTNVSRQALDDVPWLRTQLDSELIYGLAVKEEAEILSGAGTGVHLNGIITQATAFDTATYDVAVDGWTYLDQLRNAKLQARLAGLATYAPNAYILHPSDMAKIELLKSTFGLYIVGDPITGAPMKFIWGLPVVESDSISAGTFLVGAFDSAVTLIDRMATTVDISFEHASNFTANLATVLCEERIGLAVRVPTAFITGTFSKSPA